MYVTLGRLSRGRKARYTVKVKGKGYVGDIFRTGGMGRNAKTAWYFEDTQLKCHFLGHGYASAMKAIDRMFLKE